MSYKLSDTEWKFTAPQEGEVDSAENKVKTLEEIDDALITPANKALLQSAGKQVAGTKYDSYSGKYVISLHEHATPSHVPLADKATSADSATHATGATSADKAGKLTPGAKINGHAFDGTKNITVGSDSLMADVPGARRQFFGTVDPPYDKSLPSDLRNGDIYIKYFG